MKLHSTGQPVIVAIAGPNGAGKSTFYHVFLERSGLPFINADFIAREFGTGDVYEAALQAGMLREEYVARRQSFVFETVLSDPVGEKVNFLAEAVRAGYRVVVCFIGLASASLSESRVAMRVSQGGHDVPSDKLQARYPRSLENLRRAVSQLPHVRIYDNSDLASSFRLVAVFQTGRRVWRVLPQPKWLEQIVSNSQAT